ncbi:MAG: lysine--tRNA ligase [Candidatus Woesearchaeota archaeon]
MVKKLELDQSKLARYHELWQSGINPYPYSFQHTYHAVQIQNKFANLNVGEHAEEKVSVAGRLMLQRVMGKASFAHILDQSGKLQVYLSQDNLGEEVYKLFTKKSDIGDIVGITGTVFKTKTGEITVEAKSYQMLCKSLLPMPEKFHGLKDVELRYRQRYVDLFVNPESREVFTKRSKMVKVIREFFYEKGFLEMETPTLQPIYGGANAKPFVTHINAWNMKMYLSISPELYLKRMIVGGFEKVFTICKNFRNEDADTTHNPEFTMLECYQAYVDYNTMMELMEQVCERACFAINETTTVKHTYKGQEVTLDFKAPWPRLSMLDALHKYGGIDARNMSKEDVLDLVSQHNIDFDGEFSWGLGVQLLFEHLAEEHLIQPVHIINHPKESTPLCKVHREDTRLIERFESFCLGAELCNAYSELNDPILQRKLLEEQAAQLRAGSDEAHPMDEDFINCIEYGMPPTGGLGFGIDRMAIMLTGVESIRDVILFPTMKPIVEDVPKKDEHQKRSDEEEE